MNLRNKFSFIDGELTIVAKKRGINMNLINKISGALGGMLLGDAIGMPGELWPRERIYRQIGKITEFMDGPADNVVACNYKAGEYTDDSAQALVFLDALLKHGCVPPVTELAADLLAWVHKVDGFNKNILGMSSKSALKAHMEGTNVSIHTSKAETNGAAMRIAPVGCIIPWQNKKGIASVVSKISKVTHSTDVAIAGASMIAQAVASAVGGRNFDEIMEDVLEIHDIAIGTGEPTYSASCKHRLITALKFMKECKDESMVNDLLYNVIGTGVLTSESVPTALAIAYYCREPEKCALMCANLGGDTDTIGAMATSICGAYTGLAGISDKWIDVLQTTNNICFTDYAQSIISLRERFVLP